MSEDGIDQGAPEGASLAVLGRDVQRALRSLAEIKEKLTAVEVTAQSAQSSANGAYERAVAAGQRAADAMARAEAGGAALPAGWEQLARLVQDLDERVSELAAELGEASGGPGQPQLASWFDLDPDAAEADLTGLLEWMVTVGFHYGLIREAVTAECWMHHPDVVEELRVLRWDWERAYRSDKGRPTEPADWHNRTMPGAAARIRLQLRSCKPADHALGGNYERPLQQLPVKFTPGQIGAYARWWAEGRAEGVAEPGVPGPGEAGPHRSTERTG